MNKAAIQRFAMKARTDLIDQVSQRAYQYGITKDSSGDANAVTVGGRALSTDEQRQRRELVEQIQRKGYTQVMEEVAYTWFNRFIALRFMEVNNYLPSHIRVFSDATSAFKPEILNDVLHLDLPGLNTEKVAAYIQSNQTEDLYRYLLLTQCNALNDALPQMFEKMGGYTELLLPNNILKQDSVLGHMVTDIEEKDWTDQVQIIGWLYQYYNSELKDDTFALLKKNVKITKERIPSATQLFTPDWIVRYMVENSLGRIFIDKRKNEGIYADGRGLDELSWEEFEAKRIANEQQIAEQLDWKYYLSEAEQTQEVRKQLDEIQNKAGTLDVKSIKVIDPCMGSGHILVYAFDVLVQIYREYGISERDAAQSILENNLFGLDIDDRAAQLAYFAVMMKARQYDRRIFSRGIQPNIHSIVESNGIDRNHLKHMGNNIKDKDAWQKDYADICYILDFFMDAKEYGSILNPERQMDYKRLYEFRGNYAVNQLDFETVGIDQTADALFTLIEQYAIMAQKYDVVVTNPPYMRNRGMNAKLVKLVKKEYESYKFDLYAVFVARCQTFLKKRAYLGMITQHSFMFLSRFEQIRNDFSSKRIVNMIHLGTKAFEEIGGEVVQTTSFIVGNSFVSNYSATYERLVEYDAIEKEKQFLLGSNTYLCKQEKFSAIPGKTIAYWVSDGVIEAFGKGTLLDDLAYPRKGNSTSDNDRFLRLWFEVVADELNLGATEIVKSDTLIRRWFPYNKGGSFRKWYGNNEYVVDWKNDAEEMRQIPSAVIANYQFFTKPGITWSTISGGDIGVRRFGHGYIFDNKGECLFCDREDNLDFFAGFLNSNTAMKFLGFLSPTLDFNCGYIARLPIIMPNKDVKESISSIVKGNIAIMKADWDFFETSWDFKQHPLVLLKSGAGYGLDMRKWDYRIESAYKNREICCNDRFNTLKANEEELNRIFIDIYGLQDELTPEVEDKDVTVRKADLGRDICSLISYAVGCMFGRYSLDVEGLAYAGGDWDASKYSTYPPDQDNIIPICDDDYFDDDITGRFVKWVETVYGSETLEENLKFIADALGGKGTSREVIRSYFLNDFYADHLKVYQKRPIYWLFDSGKKNGFKALVYMHRYQSDLLARMRTDYVHEQQERYRTQLAHLADAIDHASASERVKLTKQQKKLQEQSLEIQKYEEKIHHLADQNIQIDLDDGVNHNYELFADVLAKRK